MKCITSLYYRTSHSAYRNTFFSDHAIYIRKINIFYKLCRSIYISLTFNITIEMWSYVFITIWAESGRCHSTNHTNIAFSRVSMCVRAILLLKCRQKICSFMFKNKINKYENKYQLYPYNFT